MRIYIGYDDREHERVAYGVAAKTAKKFGHEVIPLFEHRLRVSGILNRTMDRRGGMWDFNSSAAQSTEFAISRFAVPLLAHAGWCLFADCDVLFVEDPAELMEYADSTKAVQVVQHANLELGESKMDGQVQTRYARKLWSSVMLWNVDHPANRRLNVTTLNQWPGRDLHALGWLNDSEIGALPPEANWLVGMQPKPKRPIVAHYTLGTPNMPGLEQSPHADLWLAAEGAP